MTSDRGHHGALLLRRGVGHWGPELGETNGMVSDGKCMGDELDWTR
jgi:hypothetical protein